MPSTAAEHQLFEPFNPVEALPKSGEFLAKLRNEFGNLGLAAAAYNAGPQRVRDFLAGSRDLPSETRNYVLAVTGRAVEDWAMPATQQSHVVDDVPQTIRSPGKCRDLVVLLERASNSFVAIHNIPSWCRGLRHPNRTICGSVHLPVINTASVAGTRTRARLLRSLLR
jgi:Transglycosylase SLT domain